MEFSEELKKGVDLFNQSLYIKKERFSFFESEVQTLIKEGFLGDRYEFREGSIHWIAFPLTEKAISYFLNYEKTQGEKL